MPPLRRTELKQVLSVAEIPTPIAEMPPLRRTELKPEDAAARSGTRDGSSLGDTLGRSDRLNAYR